jgi:hypothetical protein
MTGNLPRTTSKIEALAAANVRAVAANPCIIWDEMVAARMVRDGCDRSAAADRLLAQREGSDAWRVCCAWDARQAKILPDGRKSGNWGNQGNGVARRVPRAP